MIFPLTEIGTEKVQKGLTLWMATLNLNIFSAAEKKSIRHHNNFLTKDKSKKEREKNEKRKIGQTISSRFSDGVMQCDSM